jgi:hypothetical protein
MGTAGSLPGGKASVKYLAPQAGLFNFLCGVGFAYSKKKNEIQ